VYYLFPRDSPAYWEDPTQPYELLFASANLNGSDWKVIRKIGTSHRVGGGSAFQVNDGRVYLAYSQLDADPDGRAWTHLYTANMNVDGTDLRVTQRTFGEGYAGAAKQGLQIVGQKIYYAFQQLQTAQTLKQMADSNTFGEGTVSAWTSESELDGSGWMAVNRESIRPPGIIS
jgi:hypothetical protein